MQFKPPKNDDKYRWTNHVKDKMLYYGISESLIKRIVRFPKRKEVGVAEKTIAVMQPTSSKKQEIWVMYQEISSSPISSLNAKRPDFASQNRESSIFVNKNRDSALNPKVRIISAWRYPGISPVGKKIPIPEEILQELENLIE